MIRVFEFQQLRSPIKICQPCRSPPNAAMGFLIEAGSRSLGHLDQQTQNLPLVQGGITLGKRFFQVVGYLPVSIFTDQALVPVLESNLNGI